MGQVIRRLQDYDIDALVYGSTNQNRRGSTHFRDLCELPPELSLTVLSYLDATDLCLAACIWDGLGNDEVLWMSELNAELYDYLHRMDVLDKLVLLQNFENVFLPNALRKLFVAIAAPSERGTYLEEIIQKFSQHFCNSNPQLDLSTDAVYILCFSLIMLSVDLTSPHIKNKMSKREFIRNTRGAVTGVTDDLAGHLYDNIYLIGHVVKHT